MGNPEYKMKTNRLLIAGIFAVLMMAGSWSQAKTIHFSGYDWTVRPAERGGPGPNYWDEHNARVDDKGFLHLKISQQNGRWLCPEVYTEKRFGFGQYQFRVEGRIDRLDPNVVFGLFNYPTPDVGPDTTHEMDIEFARWGDPLAHNGNYTVWPVETGRHQMGNTFAFNLGGDGSTRRFTWSPTRVSFQSLNGYGDDDRNQFAHWLFQPKNPAGDISQKPMPVHINLWCFEGHAPATAQPVELIVRSFKFIPR